MRRPLLPLFAYLARIALRIGIVVGVLVSALLIGAVGYHATEQMDWLDAALNAAMILTGMGPVSPVTTDAGKVFAICYALFSGVIFLTMTAILFAPILHRFLHRFHLEVYPDSTEDGGKASPGS